MKGRIAFDLLVSASLLLVVSSKPSHCKQPSAEHPLKVTVSDLATHPQKFDGKLVCVNAVAVNGLEGDNFLIDPSKPVPLYMPSRGDPASVWFYWKPSHEQRGNAPNGQRTSNCRSFEGYFHFIDKPQIVNGVFDPGSLQLEAFQSSIPDQQPHSLAAVTLSGNVDETRRILRSDVGLTDRYKNMLLFLAANTGRDDFAQELLAANADPRFTRPGGDTSLMVAAWNCKVDIAKTMLSHGAPVNAANVKGETALMYAAQTCKDGQMVKTLLDAGADPNAKMQDNFTPLMWAAGNPLNVEELLKAGADPIVRNKYGKTAESDNCESGEAGHAQACSLIREALRNMAGRSQDR